MALAEQRALLEQLMQQLPGVGGTADKSFEDEDVCKAFLCGVCPREVFTNTKMDMGGCDKLHNDELKRKYEAAKKEGKTFRFEIEYERELEKFVNDCDRRIRSSERRVNKGEENAPVVAVSEAERDPAVLALALEIETTLAEAEKKGEEGDIDESMRLNEKVKDLELKKMAAQAEALMKLMPATEKKDENDNAETPGKSSAVTYHQQKLRVCDICGAFLSATDSDRRLADHFGGKLHIGYLKIRNKLDELKAAREEAKAGEPGEIKESGDQETSRDRDRVRDRDRRGGSRDGARYDRYDRRGYDRNERRDRYDRRDRHDRDRYDRRDRYEDRDRRRSRRSGSRSRSPRRRY